MITTRSSFLYDFTISETNKYIDFKEGAGTEITAELETGNFSLGDLLLNIKTAMEFVGGLTYNVTANRSTRIVTIAPTTSTMNLLAATGVNAANGVWTTIGFALSDSGDVTTKSGSTAIGTVYTPQYLLQDYVGQEDNRMLRDATVNKSASGLVQVHSFGTDRFFEFNIKFVTDIWQPSTGPITNNKSGVNDLRSFMQFCIQKKTFEFRPDKDTPATFYKCVLESTPADSKGTGYKLQEQFSKNLIGYYETGVIKLRIIED